ncbi:MAG: outer membrane beta-barrel protein [Acidobacteriota bacterium]
MRFKILSSWTVAVFLFSAIPLFAQVVPQAREGHFPFSAGAGLSSYNVDWGHGRMLGGTLWGDWYPGFVPSYLRGIGVEFEARDISLNRSSTQSSNFREDTIGGGILYTWRRSSRLSPYGKYLVSFGSIDFSTTPPYTHDTRTVTAPGLGVEYRLFSSFRARADYEYQFWPDFPVSSRTLHPQGFTVGAMYDFRGFHGR